MSDSTGPAPERHPVGRRPGANQTRDDILDAALSLFADHGYEGTSMRAIAAAAGVDPALVRHFFGHKDALFAATVLDRTTIRSRLGDALDGDPDDAGRRLASAYLHLWEDPAMSLPMAALSKSAITSRPVMDALVGLHMPDLFDEHADALHGGAQGFVTAISHLFGIAAFRYIGKVPALADRPVDDLADELAPVIQDCLTGDRSRQ